MELRFPNKKQTSKIVALGFMAMVTVGCTVSNIHNNKSIDEITSLQQAQEIIQVGMTMQQVSTKLGKPINQSSYNGVTRWHYVTHKTQFRGKKLITAAIGGAVLPDQKVLGVTFGTDGLVKSVDFSEQSF